MKCACKYIRKKDAGIENLRRRENVRALRNLLGKVHFSSVKTPAGPPKQKCTLAGPKKESDMVMHQIKQSLMPFFEIVKIPSQLLTVYRLSLSLVYGSNVR